ncbi:hypothetical protein BBOV_III004190 [Babesia bovis T2Bo]|uniref:Uncharacterized protein n=1 Tax=Babesia bovis TaxID=5865 RepID=A7AN48_BABBO|nr:hypothetical protein BBOV_III004190 [Babesia bovis T2Bo]EDO07982.1 hypothetical protein BBOV_III004190 [Babesia bovis T2Bo]|eukprot:XP_001611550.1 hypothetical protein [Babesia bovis T2Bo]
MILIKMVRSFATVAYMTSIFVATWFCFQRKSNYALAIIERDASQRAENATAETEITVRPFWDSPNRLIHLTTVRTILEYINETLGYTVNNKDLELLDLSNGMMQSLVASGHEVAVNALVHDANEVTERCERYLKEVNKLIKIAKIDEHKDVNVALKDNINKVSKESQSFIQVTLVRATKFLMSNRDNDLRLQVLKRTSHFVRKEQKVLKIITILRKRYRKKPKIVKLDQQMQGWVKNLKVLKQTIDGAKEWIEIQWNVLQKISDGLCPADPLLSEYTFYKHTDYRTLEEEGQFYAFHNYYNEMVQYMRFVSHSMKVIQAISLTLVDENAPSELLNFYLNGIALLEYILKYNLWSMEKKAAMSKGILKLTREFSSFIRVVENGYNAMLSTNEGVIARVGNYNRTFLDDSYYRFLFVYYKNESKRMKSAMDRFCEPYNGIIGYNVVDKQHNAQKLMHDRESICHRYKTIQDEYTEYASEFQKTKQRFSQLSQRSGENARMEGEHAIRDLKHYLETFGVKHRFVVNATLEIYRDYMKSNVKIDTLAIYQSAEMLKGETFQNIYLIYPLIGKTVEAFNWYKVRVEEIYKSLDEVRTMYKRAQTLGDCSDIDKFHNNLMTRTEEMKYLFDTLSVHPKLSAALQQISQPVKIFGPFSHKSEWDSIFSQIYDRRNDMRDVLLLDFLLPILRDTMELYIGIAESPHNCIASLNTSLDNAFKRFVGGLSGSGNIKNLDEDNSVVASTNSNHPDSNSTTNGDTGLVISNPIDLQVPECSEPNNAKNLEKQAMIVDHSSVPSDQHRETDINEENQIFNNDDRTTGESLNPRQQVREWEIRFTKDGFTEVALSIIPMLAFTGALIL